MRLLVGEVGRRVRWLRARKDALRNRDFDEVAGGRQSIDHARRARREICEVRFHTNETVGGDLENARARLRHLRRQRRAFHQPDTEAMFRRLEGGVGAHHHARDHAERGQRVARHPFRKAHRDFGKPRCVDQAGQGFQLLRVDGLAVATLAVPYNADARLRPEWDEHERTWGHLDAVRHQIVVRLIERDRHQHGHAAGA